MLDRVKDINISCENIEQVDKRIQLLGEQKLALSKELAFSICNSYLGMVEIFNSIKSYTEHMTVSDKILLCFAVCEYFQERNNLSFKFEVMPSAIESVRSDALNKIAYMKNKYTDKAKGAFTSLLGTNRFTLVNSFSLACDEVISGNCEFALLPVENSTDGVLYSFYSLIENNELNISATCEITDIQDDFKTTRFALVCKNPTNVMPRKNHSRYFEFIYNAGDGVSIYDMLSAAQMCGLRLILHNSIPIPYKTEEYRGHFIFCADNCSLDVYLLFLTVFAPQYISLGIYTKILASKSND
jgi:hypothetical protein